MHRRALATLLLWVVYFCAGAIHWASHHAVQLPVTASVAGAAAETRGDAALRLASATQAASDVDGPCAECWLLLVAGRTLASTPAAPQAVAPAAAACAPAVARIQAPPRRRHDPAVSARGPPLAA
jgi:hypothetical protein